MDVAGWLGELGLGRYAAAFREQHIDAALLPTLSADDLRELGVASLGHRKRLLAAIAELSAPGRDGPPASAPASPQAERRQLTVMFVDLVGSTELSARLDPEETREVLRAYQNTVTGEVARVGGHVAKLMGDGVLAYFGWPRADEDDPETAVRAGLAITAAVAGLSAPGGAPLAARVGIATGLVVVGDLVGEGGAREETVVGETPNLAARLQASAPPGGVAIADGTRRLLGEAFEIRDLGPTRFKGFASAVRSYLILGERPFGSRFEARRAGGVLPMVGRDQELALVLERWRQAVGGDGQALLLVGEAGIGKSRLARAILDELDDGTAYTLRYQCSPHHAGTPLWPVAQHVSLAAGIDPADTTELKLDKLEALRRRAVADIGEAIPLVAGLLGLETGSRYPSQSLSPQQQRTRSLAVLADQLTGLAASRPVLMVVEDAHWIDPTTLELLALALDRIGNERVLLVVTSRPDNRPALGGHPHVTRLTLNRLGRGPTEAIVARLVAGSDLPPATAAQIAERTDGVPLFIEELTKAVLEVRTAAPGAVVPATLHASLMARLDRVAGVKAVAQLAACIGRDFAYPLLAAVWSSSKDDLLTALDRLTSAELIFRRGTPPDATYAFKHALVRDAAHESLLRAQRQQLHGRIAEVIEARFPETARVEPELLAEHFTEAAMPGRAAGYRHRAGQQALARCSMNEATTQLTKGLELLESVPDEPDRQRRELALQVALGQASLAAKGFAAPETGRAFARARDLSRALGDPAEILPVLYGQSVFHFQRGELTTAHEVARELGRAAEDRGDMTARVAAHRMMGSALSQLGRFAASRGEIETALALYDPVRDRGSADAYAIDSRVMCLAWLSHLLTILGHPEPALAHDAAAAGYARELAHPYTSAVALGWSCILRQLRRDRDIARDRAEAVIALGKEQGFPLPGATGRVVRGWALASGGRAAEGIAEIRRGLADYTATGAAMWVPYFLGLLAEAHGHAGEVAEGLALVSDALAQTERMGTRWIKSELHRLRGELLLARHQAERREAEACLRRALAVAAQQGAKHWELRAATSLARLLHGQGRDTEASAALGAILRCYAPGLDLPDLGDAEAALGPSR